MDDDDSTPRYMHHLWWRMPVITNIHVLPILIGLFVLWAMWWNSAIPSWTGLLIAGMTGGLVAVDRLMANDMAADRRHDDAV